MPNNTLEKWDEKTLGELCDVLDSRRKPITKKDRVAGVYPYYGATGILDYVSGWIFDEELVLLGEDGAKWTSGEQSAFKINGKTWVNNHAHVLRPKRDRISDTYLIYNLNFQNLMPYITGTTVPKLNQEKMRSITIPLPPLSEQERIVAKLDKAFETIDKVKSNAEQNLNNAKELYKVVLNKVFNSNKYQFEHIKLDDLCEIITDGTHQTPTYADKGVIFLSAKNVTSEVIDWENIKYIPDNLHNELKKRVSPQKGDILLAKNGTTGVAAIVDRDCVFDIYVSLCMLRPKKTVNVQYLLLAINNPITKDKFNKSLIGIGVPNLHLNKIRETTVPIPSPKFQDEISSLLNGLKAEYLKLEQIYIKKIKECDELKQSILQKAFRGEL